MLYQSPSFHGVGDRGLTEDPDEMKGLDSISNQGTARVQGVEGQRGISGDGFADVSWEEV